MSTQDRFLLIGNSTDDVWYQVLKEATASLGTLQITEEAEALRLTQQQSYNLIIIDAAKVKDVFWLASSIRLGKPDAKIIVATVSPTWRRAREAFRAGATDYIRKSVDKEEIVATLRATIGKMPPPWRY